MRVLNFKLFGSCALVLACAAPLCVRGEDGGKDSKDDDDAKAEAALVEKVIGDDKIDSVSGKVALDPVPDGQQPAKVVGTLSTKDMTYKIQLLRPAQFNDLKKFDKQVVVMRGHVVDKTDQGKTIYFEELDFAAGRAPSMKKRGGL